MSFTSKEHSSDELRAMGKQRILLVDDEPDILDFIEYNLVKEGYDVHTANNGREGVALAKKLLPKQISICLSEILGVHKHFFVASKHLNINVYVLREIK